MVLHEFFHLELQGKGFLSLVKDLKKEYQSSFVFLLETHSSGDKARKLVKKTGFSGNFIVDAAWQSGGIWCLWDLALWKVEVLTSSNQFVHMQVTWKGTLSWLITVVYASTSYVKRQELWDEMASLASSIVDPWVVLGDFNSILAEHERMGGTQNFSNRGVIGFRNMMQDCNLLDMGF